MNCIVCGTDLPRGSRRQRQYCSGRCRVAHQRAQETGTEVKRRSTRGRADAHGPENEDVPVSDGRQPGPSPDRDALPRTPRRIEVRVVPSERLRDGSQFSGRGGRTTYVVDGRSFDTPREAIDFASR